MKYRDRLQVENTNKLIFVLIMVTVLFVWLFDNLVFGGVDVVNPDVIFKDEPPEDFYGPVPAPKSSLVFSRFKGFENATLSDKLAHWEAEYNWRSVKYNNALRDDLVGRLAGFVRSNSVFVDSGAHVGDTSLPILARLREMGIRNHKLVLVEPDYSKCLWIKRMVNRLNVTYPGFASSVFIVNAGIWSHHTSAHVVRDKSHPGAWVVTPDVYRIRGHMKHASDLSRFLRGEVALLSISDILGPRAHFVLWHLDVEGSEQRALLGLLKTPHRPIVVYESRSTKGVDFLYNKDFLMDTMGYRLHARLPPNADRVMVPPNMWRNGIDEELPWYI